MKSGHLLGRVCAQFSLHSLMRMGVGIRSGRYIARNGDILFMDFAMNRCVVVFEVVCVVVLCVCVHCVCSIWFCIIACCVCIGVVAFTRSGFLL